MNPENITPLYFLHPQFSSIVYSLYLQGYDIESIEMRLMMLHNVRYDVNQINSIIDEYNEMLF